jgi:hypothetical protein
VNPEALLGQVKLVLSSAFLCEQFRVASFLLFGTSFVTRQPFPAVSIMVKRRNKQDFFLT